MRERLYGRLIPDLATGCLLWAGSKNQHGYGVILDGPWPRLVHRVAWELEHGPIPEGLVIDHVYDRGCRHRHCANVAHLEPVTLAENFRRGKVVRRISEPPRQPGGRPAGTVPGRHHLHAESNPRR